MGNTYGSATPGRPLLIRGGGIVSLDASTSDLLQGDLLIENGKIVAIAPSIPVEDAEIVDASAMIVMPGFVDGHRHLWEGLIRHTLPTEDLQGYLRLVNGGWGPAHCSEDAYLGTYVSALNALDAGITTVFDWSHIQSSPDHTAATIQALRDSGLRTVFGFGMPARQDIGHQWPHDLLRLQREAFSSTDQLLTLALASLSPEHVPDEMAREHFKLARDAGLIISVHSGHHGGSRPGEIARFGREGLLGPDVNLVHCNALSSEEWEIIADTGTSVCITPGVELQMGHGIPPIQQARDVGVKPSLGIDVETTAPSDMFTQMRIVYGLQRSRAFELLHRGEPHPEMMVIDDVLELATMAGAVSARLEKKIGSLTVGKDADIVLLRTDTLNVMPVNHMRNAVVLNMDARNVDTVIVAGNIVKRDGRMLGVDLAGLSRRLYASRDRIFAEAGATPDSPIHRLQTA